jgi:hypothetical protein
MHDGAAPPLRVEIACKRYTTQSLHVQQNASSDAQLVVSIVGDALIEPFWLVMLYVLVISLHQLPPPFS